MFDPDNPQGSLNNPYHPNNQYNPELLKSLHPQSSGSQPSRARRQGMGCLISLLFIGICIFIVLALQRAQTQPPAFFFQVQTLSFSDRLLIIGVAFGLLILFGALARVERRSFMSTLSRVLMLLTILAGIGATLFWSVLIDHDLGLTSTSFTRDVVSINAGDTLYFHNLANGFTQHLCVGVNQQCQPGNTDPAALDAGLSIQPGQTVSVVFDTAGTYQITSTTTPQMDMTVNVNEAQNGGGGGSVSQHLFGDESGHAQFDQLQRGLP